MNEHTNSAPTDQSRWVILACTKPSKSTARAKREGMQHQEGIALKISEFGMTRIDDAQHVPLLLGKAGDVPEPKINRNVALILVRIGADLTHQGDSEGKISGLSCVAK